MSGDELRVGILVPNFGGGGAEFVAREWALYLQRSGHEVTVFLTHPLSETSDIDINSAKITTTSIKGRGPLAHIRNLRAELVAHPVDVLLSLMPYFNLVNLLTVMVCPRRRRPASAISGRNVDRPFRKLFGPKFAVMQLAARILYRRAHAYVAISHPVAAEAIAAYGVSLNSVYVVLNPATSKVKRSHVNLSIRPQSDKDLPLSLVVPARLVPQKRPTIAIDTAEVLLKTGRQVRVVYFGDGPCRDEVLHHAEARGVDIDIRGWVPEWFAACPPNSVVLLPSVVEGFGNVLVEAAAVGVPSVASSRCLGAADAIVHGITGEVCMGDAPGDYAAAVEHVAGMEVNAATWLERFDVDRSGQDLVRALKAARDAAS